MGKASVPLRPRRSGLCTASAGAGARGAAGGMIPAKCVRPCADLSRFATLIATEWLLFWFQNATARLEPAHAGLQGRAVAPEEACVARAICIVNVCEVSPLMHGVALTTAAVPIACPLGVNQSFTPDDRGAVRSPIRD